MLACAVPAKRERTPMISAGTSPVAGGTAGAAMVSGGDGGGGQVTDGCGNACPAEATCSNAGGVFECACKAGYVGDGTVCSPQPSCSGLSTTCGPTGNDNCCAAAAVPGGSFVGRSGASRGVQAEAGFGLRFSGAPRGSKEPLADLDWIRVGPALESGPNYAAPTLRDAVSDVVLDGVPKRAIVLRPPSVVAWTTPAGDECTTL